MSDPWFVKWTFDGASHSLEVPSWVAWCALAGWIRWLFGSPLEIKVKVEEKRK